MAELAQRERLQPSLLDRLRDDDPRNPKDAIGQQSQSARGLRESLLRDLGWLLNSRNLASVQDLSAYPEVARSVVNFGLPDLVGQTASDLNLLLVERLLAQAIQDFEPRIIPSTLKVKLDLEPATMSHNAMTFDIEGELWAQPLPLRIRLRTQLDLEAGQMSIADLDRAGGR